LCWRDPNLAHVNDTFGAALQAVDVTVLRMPGALDALSKFIAPNLEQLDMALRTLRPTHTSRRAACEMQPRRVNSKYVKTLTDRVLDTVSTILHPPACSAMGTIPGQQGRDAVACVGRVAPVNQLHDSIETVQHSNRFASIRRQAEQCWRP